MLFIYLILFVGRMQNLINVGSTFLRYVVPSIAFRKEESYICWSMLARSLTKTVSVNLLRVRWQELHQRYF